MCIDSVLRNISRMAVLAFIGGSLSAQIHIGELKPLSAVRRGTTKTAAIAESPVTVRIQKENTVSATAPTTRRTIRKKKVAREIVIGPDGVMNPGPTPDPKDSTSRSPKTSVVGPVPTEASPTVSEPKAAKVVVMEQDAGDRTKAPAAVDIPPSSPEAPATTVVESTAPTGSSPRTTGAPVLEESTRAPMPEAARAQERAPSADLVAEESVRARSAEEIVEANPRMETPVIPTPQEEPRGSKARRGSAERKVDGAGKRTPSVAQTGAANDPPSTPPGGDEDVVRLKNGEEFVGRVTHENARAITVAFAGGEMVVPRRLIKEIIRAERREVEKRAVETIVLGRCEAREEYYFLYYRGRRVGWRVTGIAPDIEGEIRGYRFRNRTVFLDDGGTLDMEMSVSEFVDRDLRPVTMRTSERSEGFDLVTSGVVERGHLDLRRGLGADQTRQEILFADETEFLQSLTRRLADLSHFPEKGQTFKVYDSLRSRFVLIEAHRSLRKEIVVGKHQFVTVWKLTQGKRSWEIWIDGYGGIVREELGGPHMVAMRADADQVLAYSRGEADDDDRIDLTLNYENVPERFALARPNLTWSFEFPDGDSRVAISLMNPTLQASADVIVLPRIGLGTAPESIALDLLSRMNEKSDDHSVEFQRPGSVGGVDGIHFESVARRKETMIRTIGAVTVCDGRAYALLMAAPAFRFEQAREQLERIRDSFNILDAEVSR